MAFREVLQRNEGVAEMWNITMNKFSNKEAIVFQDKTFTFSQVEQMSNKVSHWAVRHGVSPGDCVALSMENRPEYIVTWLGLTKIGAKIALLNFNIKGKSLVHAIAVANASLVIVGSEVAESMMAVSSQLSAKNIEVFSFGGPCAFKEFKLKPIDELHSIDALWNTLPTHPTDKSLRSGHGGFGLFGYIYTSGTTGLPKACRITHAKFLGLGTMFSPTFGCSSRDRLYTVLPLYHSAGGGLGAGAFIQHGCTFILRRKFSARNFWKDCKKYNATVVQYIGELCRYLLMVPESDADTDHCVRLAFGNGLRPEIWDQFQRRFNVVEIGEFYGATEGNSSLTNHCKNYNNQGSVGRVDWLTAYKHGIYIVKFDVEKEQPVRGDNGRCVLCGDGEPGELLFRIGGSSRFEGYSDKSATAKKILENVFKDGDRYFRTGDLLKRDSNGFFYFVDRIGDTFRWKGENVSTMEVSEVLSSHESIQEANVYGVKIPGSDGRGCMAAVVVRKGMKLDSFEFVKYVKENLPSYSVPLFVRFLPEVDVTGTFKHKKNILREEGFDTNKIQDEIWYLSEGKYKVLDRSAFLCLVSAKSAL